MRFDAIKTSGVRGPVDWSQVADAYPTLDALMIRATRGSSEVDAELQSTIDQLIVLQPDWKPAVYLYHFADQTDPQGQVNNFVSAVRGLGDLPTTRGISVRVEHEFGSVPMLEPDHVASILDCLGTEFERAPVLSIPYFYYYADCATYTRFAQWQISAGTNAPLFHPGSRVLAVEHTGGPQRWNNVDVPGVGVTNGVYQPNTAHLPGAVGTFVEFAEIVDRRLLHATTTACHWHHDHTPPTEEPGVAA